MTFQNVLCQRLQAVPHQCVSGRNWNRSRFIYDYEPVLPPRILSWVPLSAVSSNDFSSPMNENASRQHNISSGADCLTTSLQNRVCLWRRVKFPSGIIVFWVQVKYFKSQIFCALSKSSPVDASLTDFSYHQQPNNGQIFSLWLAKFSRRMFGSAKALVFCKSLTAIVFINFQIHRDLI